MVTSRNHVTRMLLKGFNMRWNLRTIQSWDRSGHYCREETWPKPLGWFASLFAFSSLEDLPTRLRLKPSYSSSGKNTTTKEYYTFSLQELPAQFGQWQGPNVLSTVNQEKQEPLYVRRLLWRRCWLEDRLCICRKIVSGRSIRGETFGAFLTFLFFFCICVIDYLTLHFQKYGVFQRKALHSKCIPWDLSWGSTTLSV